MSKSNLAHDIELVDDSEKLLENFKQLYRVLNASNCKENIIEAVYADDIHFEDCFHHIEGIENFKNYCASLYENLNSCEFEFHDQWSDAGNAMLTWTMQYSHPKLNRGSKISVQGATQIRFNERIYFHRDYYDGGELLYEHVPFLSLVIDKLKKRIAS